MGIPLKNTRRVITRGLAQASRPAAQLAAVRSSRNPPPRQSRAPSAPYPHPAGGHRVCRHRSPHRSPSMRRMVFGEKGCAPPKPNKPNIDAKPKHMSISEAQKRSSYSICKKRQRRKTNSKLSKFPEGPNQHSVMEPLGFFFIHCRLRAQ